MAREMFVSHTFPNSLKARGPFCIQLKWVSVDELQQMFASSLCASQTVGRVNVELFDDLRAPCYNLDGHRQHVDMLCFCQLDSLRKLR